MALNPNIILSANRFDPVGAMSRGATAANQQNAFARQTAYDQAVTQNGAAALRGDANAQNALAGFDPGMVQGLQVNALGMQSTRQLMDVRSEELAMKREEAKARTMAELETKRGQIDMAKAAQEAAKTRDLLVRAGRFQSQGDEAGYNLFLQQNGVDPREYPMAEYRYIAATMEGVLDAVDAAVGANAGPEWRPATPQEAAAFGATAGQINTKTGKFDGAPLGRTQTTTVDPVTGKVTISEGTGGAGDKPQTVGDVYTPGEITQAVGLIDDILSNKSLGKITGPLEGGGGNNIDELSAVARLWYGEEGLDAIDKTNQLQSQAWMAARAMLKGGGQITDYESKKAEAAVARLSRAKGEAEFRSALTELKEAIVEGQRKLEEAAVNGGANSSSPPQPQQNLPASDPEIDALLQKYSAP